MKVYSHLLVNQPKGKIYPEGFQTDNKNTYNMDQRLHQGI
jgi:hypothetical protein